MPRFQPNNMVETTEPSITVDRGLNPGLYRFQLVVIDNAGRQSEPVERVVRIVRVIRPPQATPDEQPDAAEPSSRSARRRRKRSQE